MHKIALTLGFFLTRRFWTYIVHIVNAKQGTVMRIIKLKIFPVPVRLHSGYGKLIFVIISLFFAIFKNVVYSLELLGVSPGSKLCTTFLNISKHFKTVVVRLRLIFQFTYVQYCISIMRLIYQCPTFCYPVYFLRKGGILYNWTWA